GRRRVEESEVSGWIDRLTRSILGVAGKIPPEKFSGGGWPERVVADRRWGGRTWEEVGERNEHSGMESPDGRLASVAQCIKQLRDYKKFILVKNKGVPDLTMVDFRGITRVPVHGQPEDIYEQISAIITEYITPEESIILNVLSTSVDFSTCESIRMSQRVDVTGQRTLAVARKQTKIMKLAKESYEEARIKEVKLFEAHLHLKWVDKSIVE
ncbi:dynamin-related protein 4C-like protein, partial [Tanacetum coccineum]